jgi:transposase
MQGTLRYVLKRNPVRAEKNRRAREDKKKSVQKTLNVQLEYLKNQPKASKTKALKVVTDKIKRLKIDDWLFLSKEDCTLSVNEEALAEESRLDGCYAIKTDLLEVPAQIIHDRYKELAHVEWGFRTCKSDLELRPVFVRSEESTYGHIVIVMLAYMIIREIDKAWEKLYLTTREGLGSLAGISLTEVCIGNKIRYQTIPQATGRNKQMLEALGLELPPVLFKSHARVVTRKARRKTASKY